MPRLTERERNEIRAANATGGMAVVFIHGLWLHASSWGPWIDFFEEAEYATVAPGWPGEPETVQATRERPEAIAGLGIDDVTEHFATVVRELTFAPILIGHSVGGLVVEKLLAMGLGAAGVAIDAPPFRGVLPLPMTALKSAMPVLRRLANRRRAVSLTRNQFRYAFGNALPEEEAQVLYERHAVPAPGRPIFQVATANLDRGTEAKVDTRNPSRGPLLLIAGSEDRTVPPAITKASYDRFKRSSAVTELRVLDHRGHSLTIDHGWRDLAECALEFAHRHGFDGGRIARKTLMSIF